MISLAQRSFRSLARFATLYFVSDRERLAIKYEIHAGAPAFERF